MGLIIILNDSLFRLFSLINLELICSDCYFEYFKVIANYIIWTIVAIIIVIIIVFNLLDQEISLNCLKN